MSAKKYVTLCDKINPFVMLRFLRITSLLTSSSLRSLIAVLVINSAVIDMSLSVSSLLG